MMKTIIAIAASAALTLEFIASDIVNLNGRFELAFRYPSITCCVFASLNFRTVAGPNVLIRSQAAKGE